ncbi:MAG TPA: ABC transporter permease, partial [Pyrinomonadaceae bacterium]|nr:ABC transporter permease [Pyrinomonadaceae bacterium]
MNSRIVAAIARKDLVDAIRNRYILIALLTPLLVAILFRVLLPGINSLNNLTIVVHDEGQSKLVAQLRKMPQIKVVEASSAGSVKAEVEKSKAVGGLVVPPDFDVEMAAEKQPELTIFVNNKKNMIEQATFRRLVEQHVLSLVKNPVPVRMDWIDVGKEPGSNTNRLDVNQMLLPLLLLLAFGMTGSLVVPLLLVEEKEKRTLDFLLTSPASLTEIIIGKALTGVTYSLLIAALLLVINHKLIKNWPLTLLTILLGLLFVVGIGLFMGSLFKNTMQVNTWASLVLFALLAPAFPSPGLPAALETAMRFVPTYYFIDALSLSLSGTASRRLWGDLALVLTFTLVAFGAAIWALRR